ncbi:MAG TPA: tryptophan 2,3-dioxygenase family protein [Actinospica sp.]|jgi:tryptophan 2,3-dioxygenase|nr:tryptophan 2,3-dioxygenase family protein [Actinospica sp.]
MMTDQVGRSRTATSEYAQYACLDELLRLQWPRTEAPAELSFIITTQVMELYFKLLHHEWSAACAKLDADDVRGALVDLRRGHGVQDALTASWEALRTLTPAEFDEFRDAFGAASGIQSELYRDLEQALGVPYPSRPPMPSLADAATKLLERRGLADGWREVYAHSAEHPELIDLGEALFDAADRFTRWKQRHLLSVWRSMGAKPGSAGTSGAEWLARGVHQKYLPELWDVRAEVWA